ncbi:MAG: hypothetical protein WA161_10205 [Pseudomonas sp.]|uniref:hypothetical protein n=1 Tax=Pseudomonas sp. TaxID=306 RepID=UPI003BB6F29D
MSVEVFGWEWLSAYLVPLLGAGQVVLIGLVAWLLQRLLARGLRRLIIGSADNPGVRGRVLEINLIYTTLEDLSGDAPGTWMQVPNSLSFQKAVRRWRNGELPTARKLEI